MALEKLVKNERRIVRLEDYQSSYEFDVSFVSSGELPHGNSWQAVGVYSQITRKSAVSYEQTPQEIDSTYFHEYKHSLDHRRGIPTTEIGADMYATEMSGRPCDRQNYHLLEAA